MTQLDVLSEVMQCRASRGFVCKAQLCVCTGGRAEWGGEVSGWPLWAVVGRMSNIERRAGPSARPSCVDAGGRTEWGGAGGGWPLWSLLGRRSENWHWRVQSSCPRSKRRLRWTTSHLRTRLQRTFSSLTSRRPDRCCHLANNFSLCRIFAVCFRPYGPWHAPFLKNLPLPLHWGIRDPT